MTGNGLKLITDGASMKNLILYWSLLHQLTNPLAVHHTSLDDTCCKYSSYSMSMHAYDVFLISIL